MNYALVSRGLAVCALTVLLAACHTTRTERTAITGAAIGTAAGAGIAAAASGPIAAGALIGAASGAASGAIFEQRKKRRYR